MRCRRWSATSRPGRPAAGSCCASRISIVGRTRPEFVAGIFEDLRWLGLEWEEPVLFQSQRMEAYRAAAARLEAMGLALSVLCHAFGDRSGGDGGASDPDGAPLYPGLWKGRAPAEIAAQEGGRGAFALRIDMDGCAAGSGGETARAPLTFAEMAEDGTIADRRRRAPSGGAMP